MHLQGAFDMFFGNIGEYPQNVSDKYGWEKLSQAQEVLTPVRKPDDLINWIFVLFDIEPASHLKPFLTTVSYPLGICLG